MVVGFKITSFLGAQPNMDPHALPDSNAQVSINQKMGSGALEAHPQLRLLKNTKAGTNFVYRIPNGDPSDLAQSHWIEFADQDTDMFRTPVVNDGYRRYYWASPSTGFRYATESQLITGGAGAGLVGGVQRPATPITLDIIPRNQQVEGELKITRSYVATFVTTFGEEGAPNAPVEAEGYEDDIWRLRDIPQPVTQAGHSDVQYVRIYRTETSATGATVFNQVVDLQVGVLIYEDTLPSVIVNGQPQLASNDNDAPPPMDGLALMPNGIFVGFKGNNLYFSKNFEPHAWPASYTLTVQHPIVGLAVYGTTCVVCTQGNPVAVTGTSGDTMTLTASDTAMPCSARQSIAVAPEGVYFATPIGLVLYTPSGPAIVTDELIGRRNWERDYVPVYIHAVMHQGAYVGIRPTPGFFLGFQIVAGSVTEIQVAPYVFGIPFGAGVDLWSGKSWVIVGQNLYEIFPSSTPDRDYDWTSKVFRLANLASMGAGQVYADGPVRVMVYAGTRLMLDRTVSNREPFRLPGGYKSDVWSIRLIGSARLRLAMVAETVADLKKQ